MTGPHGKNGGSHNGERVDGLLVGVPDVERCVHEQKDGFLITDGEGIGLWVNRAMRRVVGLTPEYFLHRPIRQLYEEGIFRYQAVTERARCQRSELTDVQVVSTGNNVLVTSMPLTDREGNVEYVVSTVRNIAQICQGPRQPEGTREDRDEIKRVVQQLGIVYRSAVMRQVLELAAKVANSEASVLIVGETGVGKELIARLIHELSPRRNGPFIRVNCSALPKELAESELFGYEPGAFTGARASGKPGLFEAAHTGTLLLDEIGDMPREIQPKLLRVLQDGEVLRVGGTRTAPVSVRVLASTNADLKALISTGQFRTDLYYRLNVVTIEIPPLRARPQDVCALLGHCLNFYATKYQVRRRFSPEAFRALVSYQWPGNVRELTNLVHRLVLVSRDEEITPDLLPDYVVGASGNSLSLAAALGDPEVFEYAGYRSLRDFLDDLEKEIIKRELKKCESIREASRRLGMPHPTLLHKIKKYGLV